MAEEEKELEVEEELQDEKINKKKSRKYEEKIATLEKELSSLKEEVSNWKNKYYEAYANLDNTRKALNRDHEEFIKYRSIGFIEKMLPALDSFEMAFKTEPENPKIKNYQIGFKMIHKQLNKALEEEGVSLIEPAIGDEFDHNSMSAMSTCPGEEDNKVAALYLKGYRLKDRLVRPATVVVSKCEEVIETEEVSK